MFFSFGQWVDMVECWNCFLVDLGLNYSRVNMCFMYNDRLLYVYVWCVCRIEFVKLKVIDKEKMQGIIVSFGKDGLVKYWDF